MYVDQLMPHNIHYSFFNHSIIYRLFSHNNCIIHWKDKRIIAKYDKKRVGSNTRTEMQKPLCESNAIQCIYAIEMINVWCCFCNQRMGSASLSQALSDESETKPHFGMFIMKKRFY